MILASGFFSPRSARVRAAVAALKGFSLAVATLRPVLPPWASPHFVACQLQCPARSRSDPHVFSRPITGPTASRPRAISWFSDVILSLAASNLVQAASWHVDGRGAHGIAAELIGSALAPSSCRLRCRRSTRRAGALMVSCGSAPPKPTASTSRVVLIRL